MLNYSFTPMLPSVTHYSRRTHNPDAALYRSRYSAEESSDAAYQKDLQNRLFYLRKRRIMWLLLMIVFMSMLVMAIRLNNFLSSRNLHIGLPSKIAFYDNVAMRESDGFFDNISPDEWDQLRQKTKSVLSVQDMQSSENADNDLGSWWQNNWKSNFACDQEVQIGNKFVCNPHRVVSQAVEHSTRIGKGRECIVYASGGNDIGFGNQFLDYSSARVMEIGISTQVCVVHVFNPSIHDEPRDNFLILHKWALYPSNKPKPVINGTSDSFKTLEETMTELDHVGKTISILALDCEGCEWDMYNDLTTGPPIHQLLIQMHGVPGQAQTMFAAMQAGGGYVITHREVEPGSNSEVWNYSFLRLARSYFDN